MKKAVSYILVLLMVFSLIGCSAKSKDENIDTNKNTADKTEEISNNRVEVTPDKPIGRIITHEDFSLEIANRINLSDYNVDFKNTDSSFSYNCVSKTNCEIEQKESNFSVEIDGIPFTLPITLEEFKSLGFKLVSSDETISNPVRLDSVARSGSFEVTTPKGNTFSIFAISKDNSRIALKNFYVIQINCEFYEGNIRYGEGERKKIPEIKFFENITGTSTIDEIIKELKAPRKIDFYEARYDGATTLSQMQISFNFSNQKYYGNFSIIAYPTPVTAEKTSYNTSFSYLINYESLNDN